MDSALLSPTNDYVFKKIFGEDIDVLADFLKSILSLTESEILRMEILDPGLQADAFDEKLIILDIRVTIKNGKVIDVEIQVRKHVGFLNRGQFYLARLLTRCLNKGEGFTKLPKAISIWITDFEIFENDDRYHHCFQLYDKDHNLEYPNSMEIHILELPKIANDDSNPECRKWLKFLRSKTEEEFMQAAAESPFIAKALETLRKISGNDPMRMEADARERALNDMADYYNTGFNAGADNERRRMALSLLGLGVPQKNILTATGITFEQLNALIAEQNASSER